MLAPERVPTLVQIVSLNRVYSGDCIKCSTSNQDCFIVSNNIIRIVCKNFQNLWLSRCNVKLFYCSTIDLILFTELKLVTIDLSDKKFLNAVFRWKLIVSPKLYRSMPNFIAYVVKSNLLSPMSIASVDKTLWSHWSAITSELHDNRVVSLYKCISIKWQRWSRHRIGTSEVAAADGLT